MRLRLPHKPVIHDRTVARALKGMLYRVKLARPLPADRNRPDILQKRVEYGNWFMGHAVVNHTVFIDCLLYTSPSPRDGLLSRMPSSA